MCLKFALFVYNNYLFQPSRDTIDAKNQLQNRIEVAENFINNSENLLEKQKEEWFANKFLEIHEEIEKRYETIDKELEPFKIKEEQLYGELIELKTVYFLSSFQSFTVSENI